MSKYGRKDWIWGQNYTHTHTYKQVDCRLVIWESENWHIHNKQDKTDYALHKPVTVRVHHTLDTFLGFTTMFRRSHVSIRRQGGNSLYTFRRSPLFCLGGLVIVTLSRGIPVVTDAYIINCKKSVFEREQLPKNSIWSGNHTPQSEK